MKKVKVLLLSLIILFGCRSVEPLSLDYMASNDLVNAKRYDESTPLIGGLTRQDAVQLYYKHANTGVSQISSGGLALGFGTVGTALIVNRIFTDGEFDENLLYGAAALGFIGLVAIVSGSNNLSKSNKIMSYITLENQQLSMPMENEIKQLQKVNENEQRLIALQNELIELKQKQAQLMETNQKLVANQSQSNELPKNYDIEIQELRRQVQDLMGKDKTVKTINPEPESVQLNQPVISTSKYLIQLAASSKVMLFNDLSDLGTLVTESVPNKNMTRYQLGTFGDISTAMNVLSEVKSRGYKDAFIVER